MKRELTLAQLAHLLGQLENLLNTDEPQLGIATLRSQVLAAKLYDELGAQLGSAGMIWADSPTARSENRRRRNKSNVAHQPSTLKGLRKYVESASRALMPEVRRQVYHTVYPPIAERAGVDPRRPDRDALADARRETVRLSARFIRAFYPTFSRANEADLIRKQIPANGKRRP